MTKRLFVGGLSYSMTEDELKKLFSEIGAVEKCDLIIDKYTNQSKGFGFIDMVNDKDSSKAIEALDGKEVAGRKIAVSIAKPREERGSEGFRGGNRNFSRDRRDGRSKRTY